MKRKSAFIYLWASALVLTFCLHLQGEDAAKKKKLLIFVSSYGGGHISIAKAIETRLKKENPDAEVVIKDIVDFAPPLKEAFDRKAFFYLLKYHPTIIDGLTKGVLNGGNGARSLVDITGEYDEGAVRKYIAEQSPDTMIAAHYGSARVLGNLREQGHFQNIPTGYVVSELVEGYTPRIAGRLDKVFLPDPSFSPLFAERGVQPGKISVTGLPVAPPKDATVDKAAVLEKYKLDPKAYTVLLASGADGLGDFPAIVRKMAEKAKAEGTPLNIIAVCGRNEKHVADLTALQKDLPPGVTLSVQGFIPNAQVMEALQAADLFVGKPGGMFAAELFSIGKPAIFIDVIGGHEREVRRRMGEQGYAVLTDHVADIGNDVFRVKNNPFLQQKMLTAQTQYRQQTDPSAQGILDFIRDGQTTFQANKEGVGNAKPVLTALSHDAPAQAELLFSFPVSKEAADGKTLHFGELALRVGDRVYRMSSSAPVGLADYLYRADGDKGVAFDQETLGLRLDRLTADQIKILEAGAKGIAGSQSSPSKAAAQWRAVLKQAGLDPGPKGTAPLDVFDGLRRRVEGDARLGGEMISYSALTPRGDRAKQAGPFSYSQPIRSFFNAHRRTQDPLELLPTKRVGFVPGNSGLVYDNIDHSSDGKPVVPGEVLAALTAEADALRAIGSGADYDRRLRAHEIEATYWFYRALVGRLRYQLNDEQMQKVKADLARLEVARDEFTGNPTAGNAEAFKKEALRLVETTRAVVGTGTAPGHLNTQVSAVAAAGLPSENVHGLEETKPIPADFGVLNGTRARGTEAALAKLQKESPGEVEILLSYASSKTPSRIKGHPNPFGHVGIRIGDRVYSVNYLAKHGEDSHLMPPVTLDEYLYGVSNPTANAEHTAVTGFAYGRDTIGLRINGLKPEAVAAMLKEVAAIQMEWQAGGLAFDVQNSNCADMTARILKAGGIDTKQDGTLPWHLRMGASLVGMKPTSAKLWAMPTEVLTRAQSQVAGQAGVTTDVVRYDMVTDSRNVYSHSSTPLNAQRLVASLLHLAIPRPTALERAVTKRVYSPVGSTDVRMEQEGCPAKLAQIAGR